LGGGNCSWAKWPCPNYTRSVSPVTAEIKRANPIEVQHLIEASTQLMSSLYPAESCHLTDAENLNRNGNLLLGAFEQGIAVGCVGALRTSTTDAEIKRLYVEQSQRGRGLGRALMVELERHAVSSGISTLRLETGIYQTESLQLYSALGYEPIPPFGEYRLDPLSVFMEKALPVT